MKEVLTRNGKMKHLFFGNNGDAILEFFPDLVCVIVSVETDAGFFLLNKVSKMARYNATCRAFLAEHINDDRYPANWRRSAQMILDNPLSEPPRFPLSWKPLEYHQRRLHEAVRDMACNSIDVIMAIHDYIEDDADD